MMEFRPRHETLVAIYEASIARHADRPLFGTKYAGAYHYMSYAEFGRRVDHLRAGLVSIGVEEGDRVAIISNNRPEWAIAAYATYTLGAVFVAMYEAQTEGDWDYILADSGAKVVFVPGRVIGAKLEAQRSMMPKLEHIVVLEGPTEKHWHSFAGLLGTNTRAPIVRPLPSATATLIYTSGTTGTPKGVVLSHANVAYNVGAIQLLFPITPDDRSLSFLPWAHIFGQSCELHGFISIGASMGIAESVDTIMENLAEVRPTFLCAVPRIFNRIYDTLHQRMETDGGVTKALFEAAIANAEKRKKLASRRQSSGATDLRHAFYDRAVFSKIRARFGGRLRYAISGGAALSREVGEFIDNLGMLVYEGYGLSETSPIVSANYPGARKMGSVGKVIPGVEVEIDTTVTGDPKNGEIVVFGHNVMQGYYNLPEEDAKVFVVENGRRGFRTGDMGYIDGEGFLHITGRIKEQYKLLNGKYVVPTPLEESLRLSPYIANCMIHGENHEHNVAVIVPDFAALKVWAAERGIAADPRTLGRDDRVRALFADEIDKHAGGFRHFEKVKKFVLAPEDFSIENGMLTPKLSLKRRRVLEVYGAEIEALYRS